VARRRTIEWDAAIEFPNYWEELKKKALEGKRYQWLKMA
jgi:hypothetical protein